MPTTLYTLAHSPADVARWLMVAAGMGANPLINVDSQNIPKSPWPVYTVQEPNVPDNVITLYDREGNSFGRSQIDGEMWYHPGLQIRIRSTDHRTGWAKADALRNWLATGVYQVAFTIPDGSNLQYLVYNFNNISQVLPIGKDTMSRRNLFTINARIVLRQLA